MYPRLIEIPLPFEVGGVSELTVYSYGFMVVVGVLLAAWLAARELDRFFWNGRLPGVEVPVPPGERAGNKRRRRGRNRRPKTRTASPSVLMGTIATIAIVAGIAGAKLFFILENLDLLARDPVGVIFATGGLTFYGGFLLAAVSIVWFLHRYDLSARPFADAIAPGLMLAYGIGRIGCYLAGDGDWGVCSNLANKPSWIPAWLWSENFEGNILGAPATVIENCPPAATGTYPTMLYEFAASVLIFGALWALRKHPYKGGWLFSLYLVLSGAWRFLIEKIRVNPAYDLLGLTVTQAEVIAVGLMLLGAAGLYLLWERRDRDAERTQAKENREAMARQREEA
ncbi:MAG: diacylglyceryl transferase [Bacteroidetes bacterium QS_9_68_14]|nr:MAG: diacylglyceryl transferase [Bacteroidetes bacterium QS_9_68_14]